MSTKNWKSTSTILHPVLPDRDNQDDEDEMTRILAKKLSRRNHSRFRKPRLSCLVLVAYLVAVSCFLSASITSPSPLKQAMCAANNATVHQPNSVPGSVGQPCRYEGHCGVGTTCVAAEKQQDGDDSESTMPGICIDYHSKSHKTLFNVKKMTACASFCTEALGPHTVVEATMRISDKKLPAGCIVLHREVIQTNLHDFDRAAFANITRQNRVVRVDPVISQKRGEFTNKWMALCYEPCNHDKMCGRGMVCSDGVCHRNEAFWLSPTALSGDSDHHEMIIVTGANDAYFLPLMNLAGSIRHWAPKHKIVVFNLGLSAENLKAVESWGNVLDVKWRKGGIPGPPHLRLPKVYAWKPVAIKESLLEYKQIFWLDAGSTVVAPIDEVIRITQQTGIFLVKGQDDSMRLSHPCTYAAFGYDQTNFDGGPHYSGNTQAFLYPSRYVNTIVFPNAECALQRDCIAPAGSSLRNHRYDQTTLSILSYRYDLKIPHETKYLAAGRDQLEDDLKARPSKYIVWTSRGSCHAFLNLMVESYDQWKESDAPEEQNAW